MYLPPHTSHILQPLDLCGFGLLKAYYRKFQAQIGYIHKSSPILKQNFLASFEKARREAFTVKNIKAGWAASGLWPVRVSKPLMSRLLVENNASKSQDT